MPNFCRSSLLMSIQKLWKCPRVQCFSLWQKNLEKGSSTYYVNTFSNLFRPTHYVSINAALNVSENCHFLNPPTQSFWWRDIWMVPYLAGSSKPKDQYCLLLAPGFKLMCPLLYWFPRIFIIQTSYPASAKM